MFSFILGYLYLIFMFLFILYSLYPLHFGKELFQNSEPITCDQVISLQKENQGDVLKEEEFELGSPYCEPWREVIQKDWGTSSFWLKDYQGHYEFDPIYMSSNMSSFLQLFKRREWRKKVPSKREDNHEPIQVLEAGCGASYTPFILKYWGYHVTAVDFSKEAIKYSSCLIPRCRELTNSQFSLKRKDLQEYKFPGGNLKYIVGDWNHSYFEENSYDIIYCKNGMRAAPKHIWRQSLRSFWRLLKPGGILFLETTNALMIYGEIEQMLKEEGFESRNLWYLYEENEEEEKKVVFCRWPTG